VTPSTAPPTALPMPVPATTPTTRKDEETDVRLDTVQELLTAIDGLPAPDREVARRRVDAAIERPAPEARAALGLLALDVFGVLSERHSAEVIVLPEPAQPAAATA